MPCASQAETSALRVLVADDRADVLEALRLLLKGAGHRAKTVDSPQGLLRAAGTGSYDLILMDLNYARDTTSGSEGLELLDRLHERDDLPPVIVMTAWGNIDLAVEAMRRGACDFIQKPWDNERLLNTLAKYALQGAERRQAERRARSELEIARNVQQKLFPQQPRRLRSIDYEGRCVPAHEVGGDYYDFLDLGGSRMGFLLADVSGKGIAAALLMANLQGCMRSQAGLHRPAGLLGAVNGLFYDSTPPEQYATLFYGEYDDQTRQLRYVNCGHLPPVLVRNGGTLERLEATATVVGAFQAWQSEERSLTLAPGDTLVIFSDGVSEAGIETGEEFGELRLVSLVQAGRGGHVESVVETLIESARGFSGGGQPDDITVVALRGI